MKNVFNKKFLFELLFVFATLGIFVLMNTKTTNAVAGAVAGAVANITVSVSADPSSVASGKESYISWTSTGADSCDGDGPTSGGYYTGALYTTTTFTVTCTKADPPVVCNEYYTSLSSCFVADTKVLLADGTIKNIQDVKVGDILKGEKTDNKVLGFHRPELDGKLYSFNGGRYFVTEEHPFKTINGWKSINPKKTEKENIGIKVTKLKVGDTLITEDGYVLLKTINSKEAKAGTELYNFKLDGDHTYYADGYLVHNKAACGGGYSCGAGQVCLSGSGGNSSCTGTVVGSYYNDPNEPGPYEGYDCSYFDGQSTCEQGWVTHGCSWVSGGGSGGTCAACPGSCSTGYSASCVNNQTYCVENQPCSGTPVN